MCPVCKRELAPTLSICFTCGAMVNDTVREELQAKIERISGPLERKPTPIIANKIPELDELTHEMPAAPAKPIETTQERSPKSARTETIEFRGKNTSPTLVGFQPKSNTVPDWRLQLQNSVRQRKSDAAFLSDRRRFTTCNSKTTRHERGECHKGPIRRGSRGFRSRKSSHRKCLEAYRRFA